MEVYETIWKHKKKNGGFHTLNRASYVFNQILSPWKPSHYSGIDTIEVFLQTSTLKTSINGE